MHLQFPRGCVKITSSKIFKRCDRTSTPERAPRERQPSAGSCRARAPGEVHPRAGGESGFRREFRTDRPVTPWARAAPVE